MKKILTALFLSSLGVSFAMDRNAGEGHLDRAGYFEHKYTLLLNKRQSEIDDLKSKIEICNQSIKSALRNSWRPGYVPAIPGGSCSILSHEGKLSFQVEGEKKEYVQQLNQLLAPDPVLERSKQVSLGLIDPDATEEAEFQAYQASIKNEQDRSDFYQNLKDYLIFEKSLDPSAFKALKRRAEDPSKETKTEKADRETLQILRNKFWQLPIADRFQQLKREGYTEGEEELRQVLVDVLGKIYVKTLERFKEMSQIAIAQELIKILQNPKNQGLCSPQVVTIIEKNLENNKDALNFLLDPEKKRGLIGWEIEQQKQRLQEDKQAKQNLLSEMMQKQEKKKALNELEILEKALDNGVLNYQSFTAEKSKQATSSLKENYLNDFKNQITTEKYKKWVVVNFDKLTNISYFNGQFFKNALEEATPEEISFGSLGIVKKIRSEIEKKYSKYS